MNSIHPEMSKDPSFMSGMLKFIVSQYDLKTPSNPLGAKAPATTAVLTPVTVAMTTVQSSISSSTSTTTSAVGSSSNQRLNIATMQTPLTSPQGQQSLCAHPFPTHHQHMPLSKRMNKILKAVSTYESTDDPDQWTANLESHVNAYEVEWKDVIFHMKVFFEDSEDEEIKSWWKSYQLKRRKEQCNEKDPYLMWLDIKKDLVSCYDLNVITNKAKNLFRDYKYTNETAEAYTSKIRELGRQVEPDADEARVVEMMYEHLPAEIRALMMMGKQHDRYMDFQISFGNFIKYVMVKPSPPTSNPKTAYSASSAVQSYASSVELPRAPQIKNLNICRGLCAFCSRGKHRPYNCNSLTYAYGLLMKEDPNLTEEKIWHIVINGELSNSPAIQNLMANREKYLLPRQPPNPNYQLGGSYYGGIRNSGGYSGNNGQGGRGEYQQRGRGYQNGRGSGRGRYIQFPGNYNNNNNQQ